MTLNAEQQRIFEWLNIELGLPVFADAYKGAIFLLEKKPEGYVSFIAQTGRDFMNILASKVSGIDSSSGRVEYASHVTNLAADWMDEWGTTKDLSSEELETGRLIPIPICQKISALIEDHKSGNERDKDKVSIFFSSFLEYSDKNRIPKNFVSEWRSAKRWFGEYAHLRSGSFDNEVYANAEKYFNCLNGYLYIAASSQYDRLKVLNEILDATNQ